jgi:MFS family permease
VLLADEAAPGLSAPPSAYRQVVTAAPVTPRAAAPEEGPGGVWAPSRRALSAGLILTITLAAFESLAVATVMPAVRADLGGLSLYGWVFSAYMLGSLVGIVMAGSLADRHGPVLPYGLGLALFSAGLLGGGLAPSMLVLVLARFLQGAGGGAVPAIAYVVIGRRYPEAVRPRMFAVLSTAWVVPGLAGPALSGAVAEALSWRWVFLGLLPLVALAVALTLPAMRSAGLGRPQGDAAHESRVGLAIGVSVGAGLVLAGLTASSPLRALVLVPLGGVLAVRSLLRLVPAGTLRARRGLPATILARGTLTFAFFGADAYLPLTFTSVRGTSVTGAGLALTASALAWTVGSWIQERRVERVGARRLVTTGFVLVAVGIAGLASSLWSAVPVGVAVAGWTVAGLGMGLGYSPISLLVLREAPAGREGAASSSLHLVDVLGIALGTGIGGAAVAAGERLAWTELVGLGIAFAATGVVAVLGVALSRRLPA